MRPSLRLAVVAAVASAATIVPLAVSGAPATALTPRTTPTSCPEAKLPANPADNVWDNPTYQSEYTPATLADQVIACEQKFHPKTAVLAEVAMISLNETQSKAYQNQNMWLASASGLAQQTDFKTLGIPALNLEDGPDGIIYLPTKGPRPTTFPNEMALAASMNPALAELYGAALGTQANDLHFMGVQAPDLNLDRIPNWGRIQETFGEDPVLAGEMGAAESAGILSEVPIDVLKHYGIYGQETSRRSINWDVSTSALYNTYLRPFAIATTTVAASSSVPSSHQIALMCSYGDINGQRSCASSTLKAAEATIPFSGLVRSDLDTVTTSPALLRAGVSLIKPLNAQEFEPASSVSSGNRALIRDAVATILTVMFKAGLVSDKEIALSSSLGSLSKSIAKSGQAVATEVEEDGAVLLKDGTPGGEGDLPLSPSNGSLAVIAPSELAATCTALATYLKSHHINAACTVWDNPPSATTVLLHNLAHGGPSHVLTTSVTWVAPATGVYVVDNQTYGDSAVTLNGQPFMAEPGIGEIYGENDVTLNAVAGHHYVFKETWSALGPYLAITAISSKIAVGVNAALKARSALVLADDHSAEGADLYEMGLPAGQDALISAVEARVPTSVALFTTGPVLMPWLTSQTRSLIEMWNSGGNPPYGVNFTGLVPAYGALLTGQVSPAGHLPITFPASTSESPLDTGAGAKQYTYWPGIDGTSDLDVAPLNGEVIGYGWYQDKGWPVLFPFGYGLTYATMTNTFDTTTDSSTTSCQSHDSATEICLDVAPRLHLPDTASAVDNIQVYVAQPPIEGDPTPALLLGDAQSVACRTPGTSGTVLAACQAPADSAVTITATDVGQWNQSAKAYQFTDGCYSFVLAPNAQAAFHEIANPSSVPGDVVHATFPFSPATSVTPGACPG